MAGTAEPRDVRPFRWASSVMSRLSLWRCDSLKPREPRSGRARQEPRATGVHVAEPVDEGGAGPGQQVGPCSPPVRYSARARLSPQTLGSSVLGWDALHRRALSSAVRRTSYASTISRDLPPQRPRFDGSVTEWISNGVRQSHIRDPASGEKVGVDPGQSSPIVLPTEAVLDPPTAGGAHAPPRFRVAVHERDGLPERVRISDGNDYPVDPVTDDGPRVLSRDHGEPCGHRLVYHQRRPLHEGGQYQEVAFGHEPRHPGVRNPLQSPVESTVLGQYPSAVWLFIPQQQQLRRGQSQARPGLQQVDHALPQTDVAGEENPKAPIPAWRRRCEPLRVGA